MKVIAQQIWAEPAVCIGLLVSVALLVVNLIGDPDWGADSIVSILAPLVSALGIRQLVTPTHASPPVEASPPDGPGKTGYS